MGIVKEPFKIKFLLMAGIEPENRIDREDH